MAGIALIPGLANSFLISSLLIDNRPQYKDTTDLPPITLLIAAYNEQDFITATISSIGNQNYPGPVEIIIVDDGSKDNTVAEVERHLNTTTLPINHHIKLLKSPHNEGKASAFQSYALAGLMTLLL